MLSRALALLLVAACSDLPDLAQHRCGDHVLDPGEDCDSPTGNCGAPDAGAAACRFVCNAATPCPDGWACAPVDGICRQPAHRLTAGAVLAGGSFAQGALLPRPGGGRFVAVRTPASLALYGAGPSHWLASIAAGAVEANPSANIATDYASIAGDPFPLVAAGADLLALADGRLQPVIAPAEVLHDPLAQFVGAVRFEPDGPRMPLAAEDSGVLHAYDTFGDGTAVATLDPSTCPNTTGAIAVVGDAPQAPSTVALWDSSDLCVSDAVSHDGNRGFTAPDPLDTRPLGDPSAFGPGWSILAVTLADIDGNGTLDVAARVSTAADLNGVSTDGLALWLRGTDGSWSFRPNPMAQYGFVCNGDLDRDGLTDGVDETSAVWLDRRPDRPDGGTVQVDDSDPDVGLDLCAVADLNRDGMPDIVAAHDGSGHVTTCLGDGSGRRWSCFVASAVNHAIDALAVADIDGDLVDDIAVASTAMVAGGAPDGGVPDGGDATASESALELFYGRGGAPPPTTSTVLRGYHGRIVGLTPTPPAGVASQIASDLVAAVDYGDGRFALARSGRTGTGQPAFHLPDGNVIDARFVAAPGGTDLALATADGAVRLYKGGPGHFFTDVATWPILMPVDGVNSLVFLGVPATGMPFVAADTDEAIVVLLPDATDTSYKPVVTPHPFSGGSWLESWIDRVGDGTPDDLVIGRQPSDAPSCDFDVGHLGSDGTIAFSQMRTGIACAGLHGFFADVAGDATLDLVLPLAGANDTPTMTVFTGTPDGFDFDHPSPLATPDLSQAGVGLDALTSASGLGTADVDGDGIPDALVSTLDGIFVLFGDAVKP